MIELLIIPALAFLRRIQGRDKSTHSLRDYMTRGVVGVGYVASVALLIGWDYWWNGVIWGLFVAGSLLFKHKFGNEGWQAVDRHGLAGLGYPMAERYQYKLGITCWTCRGEEFLGAGYGVYTLMVSTIL